MLPFAYYILKVIICSGILYGYYILALRNKLFHRWNRFYLLAAVVLSLASPLIKINIWQKGDESKTKVIQLLQVVNGGDEIVFEYSKHKGDFQVNAANFSVFMYTMVSFFLLAFLIKTLFRITRLKKDNCYTIIEGIHFINTHASGTPFSFFNTIFWNDKIDINSSTGKQIFKHEVAHVREKHSYDKIFMTLVLIFSWCNPFFWLIRKELNIIHEFIADQKALEDSDTAAFAAMILQATYPQQQFNITNNFFYSPLKRRLLMLAKNKNPKISYASRLLVLPLSALVFFAFALKLKTIDTVQYTGKKINVVIDAGHGGDDGGAKSENGIYEKDIALSIAKMIKPLNNNKNLNIILSREEDRSITVQQRIDMAKSLRADLFISIHIDAEIGKNTKSGLGILIPTDDNPYITESKILGGNINESFKNHYLLPVPGELKHREKGVWILQKNEWPAIIVEAGFMTNQKDLSYLMKAENQQIIARNILIGIEKYAQHSLAGSSAIKTMVSDTTPNLHSSDNALIIVDGIDMGRGQKYLNTIAPSSIKSVSVLKGESAIKKYGVKGKDGVIEIITDVLTDIKNIRNDSMNTVKKLLIKEVTTNDSTLRIKGMDTNKALLVIDGVESGHDKKALDLIRPGSIESMSVLKGASAIKKYGDKGKEGVIEITTKKESKSNNDMLKRVDTVPKFDRIFTKVENEAQFPGGQQAWTKFITNIIKTNIDAILKDNKTGTCRIRFIVNKEGNISDVEALTMKGTELEKVSVDAIKNGPKWEPAKQNGNIVVSYKEQPITFTMQEN